MNSATAQPSSQPEIIQALEDLARAINQTQEGIIRIQDSSTSLIGGYDVAPSNQNAFDSLQGSVGVTSSIYNLANQVLGLRDQVNQQADILAHQLGNSGYFQSAKLTDKDPYPQNAGAVTGKGPGIDSRY